MSSWFNIGVWFYGTPSNANKHSMQTNTVKVLVTFRRHHVSTDRVTIFQKRAGIVMNALQNVLVQLLGLLLYSWHWTYDLWKFKHFFEFELSLRTRIPRTETSCKSQLRCNVPVNSITIANNIINKMQQPRNIISSQSHKSSSVLRQRLVDSKCRPTSNRSSKRSVPSSTS